MNFRFGEREERLRQEVRQFIASHLDGDYPVGHTAGSLAMRDEADFEAAVSFNRELAKRGWIAPAWPKQYGGLGATVFEQIVFNEEFGYWGAPDTGTRGIGVGLIGATLIVHGSDEQKSRYLPKITSG